MAAFRFRKNRSKLGENEDSVKIKCPLCTETLTSIECYIEHQQVTHLPESTRMKYACSECSYSSFIKDHLRKHLMRHYDIKPFKCQNCSWSGTTKDQLTKHHINNHLNLKGTEGSHKSKKSH